MESLFNKLVLFLSMCEKLFSVMIAQSVSLKFIKSNHLPILFLPYFFPAWNSEEMGTIKAFL